MTPNNKLVAIVARRHDLSPAEAAQLRGTTLAQLTSHARHLVNRRDAATTGYDGGGVPVDDHAGRELALEALQDNLAGRDSRTRTFLAGMGRRTLAATGARSEDAEERRTRITDRLRDAGYGQED